MLSFSINLGLVIVALMIGIAIGFLSSGKISIEIGKVKEVIAKEEDAFKGWTKNEETKVSDVVKADVAEVEDKFSK